MSTNKYEEVVVLIRELGDKVEQLGVPKVTISADGSSSGSSAESSTGSSLAGGSGNSMGTVDGSGNLNAVTNSTGQTGGGAYPTGTGTSSSQDPTPIPTDPLLRFKKANSYRVWPNHIIKGGPNCLSFNNSVKLRWVNKNGDRLDRNGVKQGTVPWYSFKIPKLHTGYTEIDITELANRWLSGENRGAMFIAPTSNTDGSFVRWSGTFGTNPPELVVTDSVGKTTTLMGDLSAFTILTKLTATTPPSAIDCGVTCPMSESYISLIHFNDIKDIGAVKFNSAVMRLYTLSADDKYDLNINIFETDAPKLLLGGEGLPVEYGLSAEVGEEQLPNHPDVILAGDFREENWNATPGIWKDSSLGTGKLFDATSMSKPQFQKSQVIPDPDRPGRYYLRTCVAAGQVGGGEFISSWHPSGTAESGYMPDPNFLEEEIYVRCEIFIEQDSFWSTDYAFKFSPVGMKLQYGKGEPGGKWNGDSIWIYGSGQTPSDGCRHWNAEHNQWIIKGHSIRGHTLGQPHPTHTAYPGVLALGIAPSHLGPYDTLADGGLYGTEQNMRIGTPGIDRCIPMNRWVTIESRCKVNSVDMSNPDSEGNGIAINDGIWEMWMDGALVGGRYNLAWRRIPETGIRACWIMAYHGGNTPSSHDIWWRIKNVAIARKKLGPVVYK